MEQDKPNLEREYNLSPIQVQGFPTLAKVNPHKEVEYYEKGERTQENFRNWLSAPTKIVEKNETDVMYHGMPDEFVRMYRGGYKIPITGKVKTYSKKKYGNTMKSRPSTSSKTK